jgi:hypothetical protein
LINPLSYQKQRGEGTFNTKFGGFKISFAAEGEAKY